MIYGYEKKCFGWAEKVLESPSKFIANALTESILAQWDDVKTVCEATVGRTLEEDPSGALSLRMVLALKQVRLIMRLVY